MKTSRLSAVTVIAAAAALFLTQATVGDEARKASAVATDALKWEELSAKGAGIKIATVSGEHTKGAWAGFVKFPAGSKSGIHTHSSDFKIVVVSGTFHYGATPETERNYGAGSYVFIPANLPHSNSQPEGALLYGEQPGKFDSNPVK
jgi:quercetin dioxygenase-like cupin family protein